MRCMLLPLLFLDALPAQDTLAKHPEGAFLVMECDGPGRWPERFAGTRLQALLQSKRFAEVFAPLRKQLDAQLAHAQKEAPFNVQAAWDGAMAFAGKLRVALLFELDDDSTPKVAAYLAAEPDAKTDLAALCSEIETLVLAKKDHKAVPQHLAGIDWLAGTQGDVTVTVPRMVGDEAVTLFFTPGNETAVQKLFAKAPPMVAANERAPALHIQMDADQLIRALVASQGGADKERMEQFMRQLIGTLGPFDIRLGAEGKFTDFTANISYVGEPSPMFALMAPVRDKPPALLDYVPRQHPAFACGAADLGQLEVLAKKMLALVPEGEIDWPGLEAMVEEHAGVRLSQDIFAHLGNEYVWLSSPQVDDELEANEVTLQFGPVNGACLGLALEDGAAFARSIETILDKTGVARTRKTEKYRDLDVHRLTLPVVNEKLYWAITDKLWVLGIGDHGQKNLQGLLDGAAAAARGEAPAAFPRPLTERLAVARPKYASLSFQSMAQLIQTVKGALSALEGGGAFEVQEQETEGDQPATPPAAATPPFSMQVVIDMLDGLKTLLREHDVEQALTLTYHERDRVVQRTIW